MMTLIIPEVNQPGVYGMWSRKLSVSSAVSGLSKFDEFDPAGHYAIYPFAVAIRVRVLQIVCGISGLVVGAVGWLEERQELELGLGVPAGVITLLAASTSLHFSRGFGGWSSARTLPKTWGSPWRALGPSPCTAVPLTLLWTLAVAAQVAMIVMSLRSLFNIGTTTCIGVAGAQLSISLTLLSSVIFMTQLDLRFDASLSPPSRVSDGLTCTAVSMVPLTSSVAVNSGSGEGSPPSREKDQPPDPPT